MNLIIDGLPTTVVISGEAVPIETDHRVGMLFDLAMADDDLTDEEKLMTALRLYFPGREFTPDKLQDAVSAILWFFRAGQTPAPAEGDAAPVYSFEHDAELIYAAFLQAYGIDLATQTLHWWQFHALLRSIPETCLFARAVGYRSAEIPADASQKERERIQKMKDLYKLPLSEKQQKMETDLSALLMAGGNPLELLEGGTQWPQTEP